MADYNIYLRNKLGGSTGRKGKLSAKTTAQNTKNTLNLKKGLGYASSSISGSGKVSGEGTKMAAKAGLAATGPVGVVAAAVITALQVAEKVFNFGVNIWEAKTGESVRANNLRATAKTHASLGLNILIGGINFALTDAKRIKRQNIELEYGQEIYNLNYLGEKNKIR